MGKITNIEQILARIKERGIFQDIKRIPALKYDMESSIELVEAIGKKRNPKFVIDKENRFTYENLIRWCHGDEKMKCIDPETNGIVTGNLKKGIYIAGNTGSGKSWCLEVMAAYAMVYDIRVTIGEIEKRCLYWGNVRTDTVCDSYTTEGTLERFQKMNIVGFQDLGAEPTESMYMGNRMNVMRQILEYRGDRTDLITLITSNLPMYHKMLIERYNDRVASRLNEMCNYFVIKGKDRRKMK